jgi:hypothetical protein
MAGAGVALLTEAGEASGDALSVDWLGCCAGW